VECIKAKFDETVRVFLDRQPGDEITITTETTATTTKGKELIAFLLLFLLLCTMLRFGYLLPLSSLVEA
jgi:hypothetical protein